MANVPISNMTATWTDSGTTYNAIKMNVTDTASNAASLLMDLQVGGTSRFRVSKTGGFYINSNSGFSRNGNNLLVITAGSETYNFSTSAFISKNPISLGSADVYNSDVYLFRDAANTLAQRNATNAQTFRVYNTYTDASNYERGVITWSSNQLQIGTESAGTGSARDLYLVSGTGNIRIGRSGGNANLLFFNDNAADIGASGANRPRDLYIANQIYAGNGVRADGTNGLQALAGPISAVGASARLELAEVTAPTAPGANRVRIYAEDNGSGKTRLMALFNTGVAQQIAIEP